MKDRTQKTFIVLSRREHAALRLRAVGLTIVGIGTLTSALCLALVWCQFEGETAFLVLAVAMAVTALLSLDAAKSR
jgi:hypothetical protein